jgi:hypothetical protein
MYLLHQNHFVKHKAIREIDRDHGGFWFNMGGPMSRTRTETIQSSVLGNKENRIRCPLVISLGLDFGKHPPIETIELIMRAEGFKDAEEMRTRFLTFSEMQVCHLSLRPNRISVLKAPPGNVLHQAVLLGLCTATFFDPARPILWTNASLTRCLDLYDIRGFYL